MDDTLWAIVEPILIEAYPAKLTGRPRVDFRQVFNAVLFRLRSGCQWNRMPAELGSDSSNHRWFQRWREDGVWEKVWATLVERCDELGGVEWDWQAADAMLGKGPLWGGDVGPNPTDRAKNGTKKSLLVDGQGGPLAAMTSPANWHDSKCLEDLLHMVVVERPDSTERLCLDKGYDTPAARRVAEEFGYEPRIEPIQRPGNPKPRRRKNRRWVVERTFAWLSKCRGLLVRNEKHAENYLALFQLGCLLLWYRRLRQLTG
ncbi:IS5 family transposase [Botrimarina colliarenosi]|uniref:IS5 family transposase n=1 Tax=Botrimarina colliarenosi TaxID=2528001 RepID=UPI0011B3CB93|nr:IS5 family transposase [Botrimarina colliarenosi]